MIKMENGGEKQGQPFIVIIPIAAISSPLCELRHSRGKLFQRQMRIAQRQFDIRMSQQLPNGIQILARHYQF